MKTTGQSFCVLAFTAVAIASLSLAGCGTSADRAPAPAAAAPAAPPPGDLTSFQLEHGIGPITAPVTLSAVDQTMARAGGKVFEEKCAACHKMSERYVGPALGEVLERRSPAFVMNMALNPLGMVEKHPETKKLLAEYFVPMPNQNITPDEARQVVEYLRTQDE
jgi:cytochrome c1